jgi:molybdate transport system substrate-binding protein
MRRSTRPVTGAAGVLLVLAAMAGCGDDAPADGGDAGGTTLTVFAAASLTGAFEEIGEQFEAAHEGVEVELSFAGSSDLVAQIQQGAPADVFASADEANMEKLTADELAADPEPFATNTLQIAVPPGNPAGVGSLQDLTRPGLNLVVCAPEVPCGAAAEQVAAGAGVTLAPVSEEQSVTDVLNKVRSGEADAGLVYVTDVEAAGDSVEGVELPEAADVVNVYPIAALTGSDEADLAAELVDFVLAEDGRTVLEELGFGLP